MSEVNHDTDMFLLYKDVRKLLKFILGFWANDSVKELQRKNG